MKRTLLLVLGGAVVLVGVLLWRQRSAAAATSKAGSTSTGGGVRGVTEGGRLIRDDRVKIDVKLADRPNTEYFSGQLLKPKAAPPAKPAPVGPATPQPMPTFVSTQPNTSLFSGQRTLA